MGVGAGLYMYVVVVQKFTFAISSPDEFLYDCASANLFLTPYLLSCLGSLKCFPVYAFTVTVNDWYIYILGGSVA